MHATTSPFSLSSCSPSPSIFLIDMTSYFHILGGGLFFSCCDRGTTYLTPRSRNPGPGPPWVTKNSWSETYEIMVFPEPAETMEVISSWKEKDSKRHARRTLGRAGNISTSAPLHSL